MIGRVIRVEQGINCNYLRVLVGDKEKLVPYLKVFVEKVELQNRAIYIKKVDGLL